MELTVATFVASDFKQAEPYEGRLSCMVPWEPWSAIPRGDPIIGKFSGRHHRLNNGLITHQ